MSIEILTDTQQLILSGLNDKQTQSVLSITDSTLVIAGAGSGKTAVLTRRVAFLIARGEIPGRILCLTFTNKAAGEMNHRVRKQLEEVGIYLPSMAPWKVDYTQIPLLCTFHSLGVRLLREFGDRIDLNKEFNILDSDDQKKIIRDILKEMNIDQKNLNPSIASYFISQCKQELLKSSESRRISKDFLPVFHQIYAKYEEKLRASQIVDFDDLILLPYTILRDYEDVRQEMQNRWWHIMIDEFQDTNPAQFQLVKLLCPYQILQDKNAENSKNRSLFVVGDDAQSIYGFRGSKVEIILNFEQEYPGTKEIVLNQNYRSTQPILDLAEKILTHNPHQKKKDLFTENPEKIKINYYLARNERDEAEYILRQLHLQYTEEDKVDTDGEFGFEPEEFFEQEEKSLPIDKPASNSDPVSSMFDFYMDTKISISPTLSAYQPNSWQVPTYNWASLDKLNDSAILYRTHSQSRSLEETFLKYNLPYRLVSGTRFLDRKEIKDVLAMLKFLANGEDKISLGRFLPLVMDGVGPKTMEKILAYLEDYEYPLAPKYQEQILDLFGKMQSCWQNHNNLIDLTKELLSVTGYLRYLKTEYPSKEELQTRMENIGEIYSLMYPFDEDSQTELPLRLQRFLTQILLMSTLDQEEQDKTPKINLMSLHQSKGLEFETVFLVGVEDGLLPHQNSFFEASGMEEEVRLAYVGVTRAKKHLHLISADSRVQFGQIKANPVSRIFRPFLDTHCVRKR